MRRTNSNKILFFSYSRGSQPEHLHQLGSSVTTALWGLDNLRGGGAKNAIFGRYSYWILIESWNLGRLLFLASQSNPNICFELWWTCIAHHDVKQTKHASFVRKGLKTKFTNVIFCVGIGLHQWVCKVLNWTFAFCLPSLLFSHCHFVRMAVICCFKTLDTVTLINSHDLTQNFVIHCACSFQQEKGLRSFDWWKVGMQGQGVKISENWVSCQGLSSYYIVRDGPNLVRMQPEGQMNLYILLFWPLVLSISLPLLWIHQLSNSCLGGCVMLLIRSFSLCVICLSSSMLKLLCVLPPPLEWGWASSWSCNCMAPLSHLLIFLPQDERLKVQTPGETDQRIKQL